MPDGSHGLSQRFWAATGRARLGPKRLYRRQRRVVRRRVLPLLDRQSTVADVGCADGAFTAQVAPHVASVDAFELSALLAAEAADRLRRHPHVRVHHADATVALGERRWDVVMAMGLLTTIVDEATFDVLVAALCGAVAPGGHLVLKDSLVEGATQVWDDGTYAASYRSRSSYLGAFVDRGFTVLSMDPLLTLDRGQTSWFFTLRRAP